MKKLRSTLFLVFLLFFTSTLHLPRNRAQDNPEVYWFSDFLEDLRGFSFLESIGESVEGREIYLLRLGQGEKKILLVGALHGREWITSKLLIEMARSLTSNQEELLSKVTFLFLPMANPDGVVVVQEGPRSFSNPGLLHEANLGSEDFSRYKANARGVNLNIQFPARFEDAFSETQPHFEKYKGPHPLSEPEAKALASFVRKEDPDLVLAYHASGEVIYWFYGQEGELYQESYAYARLLSRATGYGLAKEEETSTHAGLKDWFVLEFHKPAFTLEVGPYGGDRPLTLESFPSIWEKNKEVLLVLASTLYEQEIP